MIKSKSTAMLLALFLGHLGAHQFYLGHFAKGWACFLWWPIPLFFGYCGAIAGVPVLLGLMLLILPVLNLIYYFQIATDDDSKFDNFKTL
jgi:TM2 domain-containing membrane protein YozV